MFPKKNVYVLHVPLVRIYKIVCPIYRMYIPKFKRSNAQATGLQAVLQARGLMGLKLKGRLNHTM